MSAFRYIFFLFFCFAYSSQEDHGDATSPAPAHAPPQDVASRELTDTGYVIRYNDRTYTYPLRISPLFVRDRPRDRNPTDTNAIDADADEDKRRPLFYFTTYEPSGEPPGEPSRSHLPTSGPFVEIRRKRNVGTEPEIPDSSKVGKLRRKRTYCRKCGGGGYGVSYIPVTYAVYPVYPSYGGGCYSCGGGKGGGYGGGGGGSFSYSSSSSHSSAGSFGWGK